VEEVDVEKLKEMLHVEGGEAAAAAGGGGDPRAKDRETRP
jgi:hypothetical protein